MASTRSFVPRLFAVLPLLCATAVATTPTAAHAGNGLLRGLLSKEQNEFIDKVGNLVDLAKNIYSVSER